ncbi:alpha/beta-hydrolase [Wolfiporia cocos MD-104 SS10]|uniref:Alpha/beta-hydrolase n=1 Tax=Wolfiporia cocos (strain MD-104) TaxID=742152 RepID=A0A2H3IZN1_WOLCO|nr:alpha/beta-hydrolase [Wolfiporia cocos MD-104 SS10]
MQALQGTIVPDGVTSRFLWVNDLHMHILEAGERSAPLVLFLHGFPELAVSWRKILVPIADLGYHVVAPDQRGYGRTTNGNGSAPTVDFEDDVHPYKVLNLVKDVVALAFALGYWQAAAVVGHDWGSHIAGYCALVRPDVFRSVVMMSMPMPGPPSLPFDIGPQESPPITFSIFSQSARDQLAKLQPPCKYYISYFAGPSANDDMLNAPEGLHRFLRAYFHTKSADWPINDPHPLQSREPTELAKLPHYYMMPLDATMPEAVAPHAPSEEEVALNKWLTDDELAVYVAEFQRTGFQGGLNWYRGLQPQYFHELAVFAGRRIEVPAMFLSGRQDWGVFQTPGALQKMSREVCSRMDEEDVVLVDKAGHWVQQEQPEEVVRHIGRFLGKAFSTTIPT